MSSGFMSLGAASRRTRADLRARTPRPRELGAMRVEQTADSPRGMAPPKMIREMTIEMAGSA
jgi:hypothetical protein